MFFFIAHEKGFKFMLNPKLVHSLVLPWISPNFVIFTALLVVE